MIDPSALLGPNNWSIVVYQRRPRQTGWTVLRTGQRRMSTNRGKRPKREKDREKKNKDEGLLSRVLMQNQFSVQTKRARLSLRGAYFLTSTSETSANSLYICRYSSLTASFKIKAGKCW